MAEAKRYYWLRLHDDFFDSKRIKKLRTLAGGDTFTIIYLKMQLKAMKHDGVLEYTGVEPTMAEEIALDIDEKAENVQVTLNYLINCGLADLDNNGDCFLPYAIENTGSETASAQRVRDYRIRQKTLQSNTSETQVKQICSVEKEKEKEKNIEIDNNSIRGKTAEKSGRFKPPTEEEVGEYCRERGNGIDPGEFVDYYASIGWAYKNGTKMKDWQAAIRTWERRRGFKPGEPEKKSDTPLPTTTRRNR